MNHLLKNGFWLYKNDLSDRFLESVRDDLSYNLTNYLGKTKTVLGYTETEDYLVIPRGCKLNIDICDQRSLGRELNVESEPIQLRDENQHLFVDSIMRHLQNNTCALGVASCGTGKTVMAIEIARQLNRSTAILVHKQFLVDQWMSRLVKGEETKYGIIKPFWPNIKVGICKQSKCNNGNTHDDAICKLQSVASRDYGEEFFNSFGTIIVDECHHVPCDNFKLALSKFNCRYLIGLSATPERIDGLHQLLYHQISTPTVSFCHIPKIPKVFFKKISYQIPLTTFPWNGKVDFSKLINSIAAHPARNQGLANDLLAANRVGKKAILMSDRIEQLYTIDALLKAQSPNINTGIYISGKKQSELQTAAEADIILCTYQMLAEGFDVPALDTLIFGTPRANVEQMVGRVTREYPSKDQPIIVDRIDNIGILKGMARKRENKYRELGFEIN